MGLNFVFKFSSNCSLSRKQQFYLHFTLNTFCFTLGQFFGILHLKEDHHTLSTPGYSVIKSSSKPIW